MYFRIAFLKKKCLRSKIYTEIVVLHEIKLSNLKITFD